MTVRLEDDVLKLVLIGLFLLGVSCIVANYFLVVGMIVSFVVTLIYIGLFTEIFPRLIAFLKSTGISRGEAIYGLILGMIAIGLCYWASLIAPGVAVWIFGVMIFAIVVVLIRVYRRVRLSADPT